MTELRRITSKKWEISTSRKADYEKLVTKRRLFPTKYHLFTAGLAYGLLHGKRHDKKPTVAVTKLFAISDKTTASIINVVFWILRDKEDDKAVWTEMLHIADGGVVALSEMCDSGGGDLDIPRLLDDAKKLWPKRSKSLYNTGSKGRHGR